MKEAIQAFLLMVVTPMFLIWYAICVSLIEVTIK